VAVYPGGSPVVPLCPILWAISRLVSPWAASWMISRCCGVSAPSPAALAMAPGAAIPQARSSVAVRCAHGRDSSARNVSCAALRTWVGGERVQEELAGLAGVPTGGLDRRGDEDACRRDDVARPGRCPSLRSVPVRRPSARRRSSPSRARPESRQRCQGRDQFLMLLFKLWTTRPGLSCAGVSRS
jgi:hypothetical protein